MPILDLFKLDGEVAVVTGAGTGIGRGIAIGLAEAGASVVVAARRAEMVEEVAASIRDAGGRAVGIRADVTSEDDIRGLVDGAVEAFGKLDIWVNNAGGIQGQSNVLLRKYTPEAFDAIVSLNLKAAWRCIAIAQETMSDGGRFINVSSIASLRDGAPFNGPYAAAKAGLNSLTKTYALELARRKIRVNAIAPGAVVTEDLRETLGQVRDLDDMAAEHPLGRLGRDEDFGAAAVYLASKASDWVTGAVLVVSGAGS